jgi:hypothetical protein
MKGFMLKFVCKGIDASALFPDIVKNGWISNERVYFFPSYH